MNDLKIFKNPQFGEVRTVLVNNEPMFCLVDLCKTMKLRVDNTLKRLDGGGYYRIEVIDSIGRKQQAYFINEKNMYRVIMRSDKKEAVKFQDWVCDEVLPSIRKQGFFTLKDKFEEMIISKEENQLNIFTYLFTDDTDLIKIGRSIDIHNRLKQLKIGNPTIKLVDFIDGDIERLLHRKYDHKRVIGEWFNLNEEDINHILKTYK